ncbi:MAG: YncE family protein, partial [Prevotella sp.]
MKKYLLTFAILLAGMTTFTSCSDDEEEKLIEAEQNNGSSNSDFDAENFYTTYGIYVVNSGNQSSQITGSLTYLDATEWKLYEDVFKAANGRELGLTANDGVVYGSKLYVMVSAENTVEVMDNITLQSIKQIKLEDEIGEDKAVTPRHAAAANGYVYVTTYGGYVAAIDTTTLNISRTYAVTPEADKIGAMYPEGIAVANGKLYVANSCYGKNNYPSIGVIDIESGSVSLITDEKITNPTAIAVVGNDLYVLDYGKYDENWNQLGAGVRKISGNTVSYVLDATAMSVADNKIYTINAPYTYPVTTPSYKVYDIASGEIKNLGLTEEPFT